MMGSSGSSPQKVTIERDDVSGTVKVTEAVARRLLGKEEPQEELSRKSEKHALSGEREKNKEELNRIIGLYENRLQELEQKSADLNHTTKEEFARTVEEVERKFAKSLGSPICQDLQNAVFQCYQENPKQTLFCSEQVKAFSNCVYQQREKLILTRNQRATAG